MSARRDTLRTVLPPVLAAFAPLVLAASSFAFPCEDYLSYARWIGGTATDDYPADVTTGTDFVLVADGAAGTQVVDVSVPDQAAIVATIPASGNVRSVDRLGDVAVAASNVVQLIDVSVPDTPVVEATLSLGDLVWFARFDPRLDVLGPSDGEPQVLYAAIHDTTSAGGDTLGVWDVRSPALPVLLKRWNLHSLNPVEDITWTLQTVSGTDHAYVYVTMWDGSVEIVDVTKPSTGTRVSYSTLMQVPRGLAVHGGYAYLPTADGGEIVDVSNPASPVNAGFFFPLGNLDGAEILGNDLLLSSSGSLQMWDLTSPTSPTLLRTYPGLKSVQNPRVEGNRVYLPATRGFNILDLGNPAPVPSVTNVAVGGDATALAKDGGAVYVAADGAGLQVLDVSDPDAPFVLGSLAPVSDGILDVVVSGGIAWAGGGTDGFHVIDVADPSAPAYLATVPLGGNSVEHVAIDGTLAYVSEALVGVHILDVSSPGAPALLGTYPFFGYPREVDVAGSALYVTSNTGLYVADVSSPGSPTGMQVDPRSFLGFDIAGGYAYAVAGTYGSPDEQEIVALDLSSPFAPVQVGRVESGVSALSVLADDYNFLYASCGALGLHIIDIADPTYLRDIGNALHDQPLPLSAGTKDAVVVGGRIYTAEGTDGVSVRLGVCFSIDVGAPVATAAAGIRLQAAPSPFRDATRVRFSLPAPRDARLTVHDVTGRLVRILASGRIDAGAHAYGWDGRDADGEETAAGVYFVRLRGEGIASTAKIVRTR